MSHDRIITREQRKNRRNLPGLGDAVAMVATPIARATGMRCIDPQTQELRPESRCARWKKLLNGEKVERSNSP